jgi:hypothetical protein
VFITVLESVYSAVRTDSLYKADYFLSQTVIAKFVADADEIFLIFWINVLTLSFLLHITNPKSRDSNIEKTREVLRFADIS